MTTEKILDVKINFDISYDEIVDCVLPLARKDSKLLICTTNPYFVIRAQEDPEIKEIINNSYLSVPDGVGLFYARKYLGMSKSIKVNNIAGVALLFGFGLTRSLSEFIFNRKSFTPITGIHLSEDLLKMADKYHLNVYLLGGALRNKKGEVLLGEYDMAKHAAQIVKQRYPGINFISGTSKFLRTTNDDIKTAEYIRQDMQDNDISHIDILLIAYDPIHQEKWFERNKDKINVGICVGVGRKFDYVTNVMQEPNEIYKRFHIEWLYSLMLNPWRYKRIIDSVILFPIKIFLYSLKNH